MNEKNLKMFFEERKRLAIKYAFLVFLEMKGDISI